jgi:hypothetical protein
MLLLLSGIAIGLLMSVNTEQRAGGNDLQNTMAYRSAEGGIEKMTADLANLFAQFQAPTAGQITALSALVPTGDPTTSYVTYSLTPATKPDGSLNYAFTNITTGPNQGLYAQTLPVTLSVTANRLLGQEVSMTRQSEMALIPIFQFGIFSDSDLSFFAGPTLTFQGRVHTNGDLYLLSGSSTTFQDKVSAFGNIIRQQMPNGVPYTASHTGTINVLTSSGGCNPVPNNCRALAVTEGSVPTGPTSGYNSGPPSWKTIAASYNSWLINGNFNAPGVYNAGAKRLQLSLVAGSASAQQFEIIRRPAPNSPDPIIDPSRLYTQAQIRVLLSDNPAELPGGANDPQNIRLANVGPNPGGGPDYSRGVPAGVPTGLPASPVGYRTYFAEASFANPGLSSWVAWTASLPTLALPADWPSTPLTTNLLLVPNAPQAPVLTTSSTNPAGTMNLPTCTPSGSPIGQTQTCPAYPYYTAPTVANTSTWNLIDGYLRVEIVNNAGTVVPVTQKWLELGFARGTTPPAAPGTNPINPKAILLLQQPANRDGNGTVDFTGTAPTCTWNSSTSKWVTPCKYGKPPEVQTDSNYANSQWPYGDAGQTSSVTRNNWYPINFYDPREGEVRDWPPAPAPAAGSCTAAGVMNAVEIDMGNLNTWLLTDAIGTTVDKTTNNGYILYFSDRRGMQPSANQVSGYASGQKLGDSGLEDSINTGSNIGTPDRTLDTDYMPLEPGRVQYSPEDVNLNGALDNVGAINLANGFFNAGVNVNTSTPRDPYTNRINSCVLTGRKNWVSGARHVLRLVDGSLGNVPMPGFTVGSENPLYIMGDYNSSVADPTWATPTAAEPVHSAAGVIADAVTMLSNGWTDLADMNNPTNNGGRLAATTYYRTAICAGKNMNFPTTQFGWFPGGDYGTDGGLHNFLRLVENWGGVSLNYKGSLVSLYYSTYATGTDKGNPYSPPNRNYIFDPLFSSPAGLPPGTPDLRDVDNLSYRQDFTPRGGADQ